MILVLVNNNNAALNKVKSQISLPTQEPRFVYMDVVPESEDSPEGDDDKVYMFFSENAVEYDFYNKLVVSRVARVCKVTLRWSQTEVVQTEGFSIFSPVL